LEDLRGFKIAEIKTEKKKINCKICGGFIPPKKMRHFSWELAAAKK
jgi:ribosomal protein L37E